uniref:Peptidase S33 tripeptidyl aminopeptidase-like C-terminal domain-containing protein n=1 Tax=Bionectria ochroleuca TaxID=29856 RepID=A0A8H7K2G1_BIOOC
MPSIHYSLSLVASAFALGVLADDTADFDWSGIQPTKNLVYHPCYGTFQCARLEVPLDWHNASDPRTVSIAIRTLPAVVRHDDPTFGGSILTNPGGPGGSGIQFAEDFALPLQRIVDRPGRKHYEIVSFDPRGIGYTTPAADCFHDPVARSAWMLEYRGIGGLTGVGHGHLSESAMGYTLAMNDMFARHCRQSEAKYGEILSFVNTPSVARDMVEIIDRIDQLHNPTTKNTTQADLASTAVDEAVINGDGKVPRLQYIGFSYGTALGNYFASMFPGRVGRIVVDGVTDADDYANGDPGWLGNTIDDDEILERFWKGCFQAGASICPLANDTNISSASRRFWSWVKSLDEQPRSLEGPTGDTVVLTGDDVRRSVGDIFDNPIPGFRDIANTLHRAMAGNETDLFRLAVGRNPLPLFHNGTSSQLQPVDLSSIDQQYSILCGDGKDVTGKPVSYWMRYAEKQKAMSKLLGSYWVTSRLLCSSWPVRARWLFNGPFKSPKADSRLLPGIPAAPLLFMSTELDPVTPLRAARKMAKGHPGARVVTQEGMGHCALQSSPSNCTRSILAEYFDTGKVPDRDTFCKADCGPWDLNCHVQQGLGIPEID